MTAHSCHQNIDIWPKKSSWEFLKVVVDKKFRMTAYKQKPLIVDFLNNQLWYVIGFPFESGIFLMFVKRSGNIKTKFSNLYTFQKMNKILSKVWPKLFCSNFRKKFVHFFEDMSSIFWLVIHFGIDSSTAKT